MPQYQFTPAQACNMCAASAAGAKTLGLRLNRSQGRNPRAARGAAVTIVRCRDCGLIYPDPMPVPTSLADHYAMGSEDYFVDDLRSFGQTTPERIARYRRIRELLPGDRPARAIDVGVGTGSSMRAMIEAGFDTFGFEPSSNFRDSAITSLGLSSDRILLAGIEDAEFPAGTFDMVSFGAVLEHLYDPAGSIEKALRWVRPGGLVYGEIPNARYLMARLINAYNALRRANLVTHLSPMHSPFHLYEFEERSFTAHGARMGYDIADVDYENGAVAQLPVGVQAMLGGFMRATKTGMQMHVVIRKR